MRASSSFTLKRLSDKIVQLQQDGRTIMSILVPRKGQSSTSDSDGWEMEAEDDGYLSVVHKEYNVCVEYWLNDSSWPVGDVKTIDMPQIVPPKPRATSPPVAVQMLFSFIVMLAISGCVWHAFSGNRISKDKNVIYALNKGTDALFPGHKLCDRENKDNCVTVDLCRIVDARTGRPYQHPWNSNSGNKQCHLRLQDDDNLVMYNQQGRAEGSAGTNAKICDELTLNGNVLTLHCKKGYSNTIDNVFYTLLADGREGEK
jgi:hypothetical protein